MKPPPDHADRVAAIAERRRNVIVSAGAGTGKTTLVVNRLLEMIAPSDDREACVPIERVAAVTFTRRAAGELRVRVREKVLSALARTDLTAVRRGRLRDALGALDTAYIGTIHSFADRLLRLHPIEAKLSPSYDVVDDGSELKRETYDLLMQAGAIGTLVDELVNAGPAVRARAAEAEETLRWVQDAKVRIPNREFEFLTWYGLQGLLPAFIDQRDAVPEEPDLPVFDFATFRRFADEFAALMAAVSSDSLGAKWMRKLAADISAVRDKSDPVVIYAAVVNRSLESPTQGEPTKGATFGGDDDAWNAWKAWKGDARKKKARETALCGDLLSPLWEWMSARLVRMFPVVIALYDAVKARHRTVDQLDLLLNLRDLVRDDKAARAEYQQMFDHVFVDEFQDTDPLQAEIAVYLCERKADADDWRQAVLADGKLTIVGDPKQSIYRFRRADIAMYDLVRSLVARGEHLEIELTANFRSAEPLIGWFNARFDDLLGAPPSPSAVFDASTGRAFHHPLHAGRSSGVTSPCVDVVDLVLTHDRPTVDEYRALEGEALAHYLYNLVEREGQLVRDPLTETWRPVRYSDIAVLTAVTTKLPLLLPRLDDLAIPHSVRGGTLFAGEPLHQHFLLALRAIADPADGAAEAALLRPPFFSVNIGDLVRDRLSRRMDQDGTARTVDVGAQAARDALGWVTDLRRRRFERSPGATARDVLEQTGLARWVAGQSNGAQRLSHLRELCLMLEQRAAEDGLDYDAVTAEFRRWLSKPPSIDAPHPVGDDCVQVMTIHQAKGLEFPVVVLWDALTPVEARQDRAVWRVDPLTCGWTLEMKNLRWEHGSAGLGDREVEYRNHERRRLIYVAATRARDRLVMAFTTKSGASDVSGLLLGKKDPALVNVREAHVDEDVPNWADGIDDPVPVSLRVDADFEKPLNERWNAAVAQVTTPRFVSVAVTTAARQFVSVETTDDEPRPRSARIGRYGAVFGDTVHRAIGLALADGLSGADAVSAAIAHTGLPEHHAEAATDVERALATLRAEGLCRKPGPDLQLEYPIAGVIAPGQLVSGYVDLLATAAADLVLLDFKTDAPPMAGAIEPAYLAQVSTYAQLVTTSGLAGTRQLRCGLLYTADGNIRWVPEASALE